MCELTSPRTNSQWQIKPMIIQISVQLLMGNAVDGWFLVISLMLSNGCHVTRRTLKKHLFENWINVTAFLWQSHMLWGEKKSQRVWGCQPLPTVRWRSTQTTPSDKPIPTAPPWYHFQSQRHEIRHKFSYRLRFHLCVCVCVLSERLIKKNLLQ